MKYSKSVERTWVIVRVRELLLECVCEWQMIGNPRLGGVAVRWGCHMGALMNIIMAHYNMEDTTE